MIDNVLKNAPRVAGIMKLLGNENRLKILCFLSDEELSVSEIESLTGIAQSLISQNLKTLELNNIVSARREGKWIFYKIASLEIQELFKALYEIFCKEE